MKSTKTKSKGIRYGRAELPAEAFEEKNAKFRVTMFLDLDLLDEIRIRAKKKSLPYQTYINQLLRENVLGDEQDNRIRAIVREELKKRA